MFSECLLCVAFTKRLAETPFLEGHRPLWFIIEFFFFFLTLLYIRYFNIQAYIMKHLTDFSTLVCILKREILGSFQMKIFASSCIIMMT